MSDTGILLKTGTNEMELLTVLVDDQPFGMNVAKVQSIQQYDPKLVTKLPASQPGIEGMFLYRDKTIPLLDLSDILGIKLTSNYEREIIIVTEFNNSVNSFKVQGVKRIYRVSWNELEPLDSFVQCNSYLTGSVHVDDSQVLVLDLEHILSNFFPDLALEDVADDVMMKKQAVARDQLEILFAEDSPTIRKGVAKALQQSGFENITDFVNGEDAHNYITKRFAGDSDKNVDNVVLISDIEMPQMDGLSLCRKIKEDPKLKDIYVVMFSSLINPQMVEKCKKVKAENYVTKPETNRLISILDEQCGVTV